jgi:hypothetical protein
VTENEEKEFLKDVRKMIRENPDIEVAMSRNSDKPINHKCPHCGQDFFSIEYEEHVHSCRSLSWKSLYRPIRYSSLWT